MYLWLLGLFILVIFLSYIGVLLFRRWSSRRAIYDHPNERSSHTVPTPRGGGLIIVLISLAGYLAVGYFYPDAFSWAYFASAAVIALISWADDLYSIPFGWRLLVHIACAAMLILGDGYFREIAVFSGYDPIRIGPAGIVVTFAWLIWMTNAYNFMDGIDGIAGLQAVAAGAGWTGLAFFLGEPNLLVYSCILTAASIGFLIHNWQPAKVFMGDVGSAFLGFTFAAMPLLAARGAGRAAAFLPAAALILVWFFLFDTVLTFFLRLFNRRRVWEAHREHLYQRMVIRGLPHATVALIYGAFAAVLTIALVLSVGYDGIPALVLPFSILGLTICLLFIARDKKGLT